MSAGGSAYRRISRAERPQFPCWLFASVNRVWLQFTRAPEPMGSYTHWAPERPAVDPTPGECEDPNPWKDGNVREALGEGREAGDIALLECPRCHRYSYYNEGSHFTCRFCDEGFEVLDEGETGRGGPSVRSWEAITLADWTEANDGPKVFGDEVI
jgi:hypothetical protein